MPQDGTGGYSSIHCAGPRCLRMGQVGTVLYTVQGRDASGWDRWVQFYMLCWNVHDRELLPPAYVVRREGNSFTLFGSPHPGGGGPVSHNALQHFPECHGAAGGGTLPGPAGGGGTLARGVPWPGGGTQVGQHREYLLHGGRYASCVHAGGLSCSFCF